MYVKIKPLEPAEVRRKIPAVGTVGKFPQTNYIAGKDQVETVQKPGTVIAQIPRAFCYVVRFDNGITETISIV